MSKKSAEEEENAFRAVGCSACFDPFIAGDRRVSEGKREPQGQGRGGAEPVPQHGAAVRARKLQGEPPLAVLAHHQVPALLRGTGDLQGW